jgi:hypothetical protein
MFESPQFLQFLKDKARAWERHDAPENTPIASPSYHKNPEPWQNHKLCPTFSGGSPGFNEEIFPRVQRAILEWMDEVSKTADYVNPKFEIQEFKLNDDPEEEAVEEEAVEEEAAADHGGENP